MIDNIERNILQTVDYVENAKTETKQAVTYQKKARRVRLTTIYYTQIIYRSLNTYNYYFNSAANLINLTLVMLKFSHQIDK